MYNNSNSCYGEIIPSFGIKFRARSRLPLKRTVKVSWYGKSYAMRKSCFPNWSFTLASGMPGNTEMEIGSTCIPMDICIAKIICLCGLATLYPTRKVPWGSQTDSASLARALPGQHGRLGQLMVLPTLQGILNCFCR